MSVDSQAQATVFVINADPSTRSWIEATVVAAGLTALTFNTRAELMPHIRPGVIACAVLDVNLPDGSGLELQSDLACAGIATMFLTRERCIASCVAALKAGAVDFLTVPCNSLSLVRALRDGLRQTLSSCAERVQSDELRAKYQSLTARERQVFELVSTGLRNKQIAHELGISQITVQIHRGQVMRKMTARTFASLVRMADALQLRAAPAPDASRASTLMPTIM